MSFINFDNKSKEKIKKDISNFNLNLLDEEINVRPYENIKTQILLRCGRIIEFEFPPGSQDQTITNLNLSGDRKQIRIGFTYNNESYWIQGQI